MCLFTVDTSEAGKQGSLEIEINGGSVGCIIVPKQHRQYHAAFLPVEAKQHVIQLKFNGQKLPSRSLHVLFILIKLILIYYVDVNHGRQLSNLKVIRKQSMWFLSQILCVSWTEK